MIGVRADGIAVDPAAFAFFSCRRGDDDFHISMVFTGNGISRSFAFDQFGFADDEQRSQLILPLAEEIVIFAIGIDSDGSVESMADLVFFTSAFEDTRQIAAVRQELSPAGIEVGVEVFFMSFRPIREEDTFFLAFDSRHVLPYFFCREGQDRCDDLDQRIEDDVHSRLGAAADLGISLFRVQAVFDDIQVHGTQIDGAEVVDSVVHDVELVIFISVGDFFEDLFQAQESPFIEVRHVLVGNHILSRIEVGQVAQEVTESIADLAVNVGELLQDLRRQADITLIIS